MEDNLVKVNIKCMNCNAKMQVAYILKKQKVKCESCGNMHSVRIFKHGIRIYNLGGQNR